MQAKKFNFNYNFLNKHDNEYINSLLNSSYASIKKEKIEKITMYDLNKIFLQSPYNYSEPPVKIFNETIKHFILTEEHLKLVNLIKNANNIDELKNENWKKIHSILYCKKTQKF